jgi:hypothetical protein
VQRLRRRRLDDQPPQRRVERVRAVAEPLLVELDQPLEERRLIERIGRGAEPGLDHEREARVVAVLLEQRLEDLDDLGDLAPLEAPRPLRRRPQHALERRPRARVRGVDPQDLAVRPDRRGRVAERGLVQLA